MFLMSWVMALITFVVVITLYLYVSYRKPGMTQMVGTPASYSLSPEFKSLLGI
jgi:hypothetical protein